MAAAGRSPERLLHDDGERGKPTTEQRRRKNTAANAIIHLLVREQASCLSAIALASLP